MSATDKINPSKNSNSPVRDMVIMNESAPMRLVADYKNESSRTENPEVDGIYILGILEGVFFVPDGKSINERFYSRNFWEKVLAKPDVQSKLRDRIMFGTIGHEDKYIDDVDLAAGKAAIITTDLWIDEATGLGMGKAIILGTEAGKNLYIYLKAGAQIKISSRAYGDFVPGIQHEGMPVMDERSYYLEGFDPVLSPGFVETKLSLKESQEFPNKGNLDSKLIVETVIKRRSVMSEAEKRPVQAESSNSSLEEELKRSRSKAESEVKELKAQLKDLTAKLEAKDTELNQWKTEGEKLVSSYKKYNALGKLSDLSAKLEKLEAYESIAKNPADIRKILKQAAAKLEANSKHLNVMESAGNSLHLAETALQQYMDLVGPIAEARRHKIKMERALQAYTEIGGTISDVVAMKKKCEAIENKLTQEKLEKDCRKYSILTNQSLETVQSIFENAKSKESALEVLESMAKSRISNSKKQFSESAELTEVEVKIDEVPERTLPTKPLRSESVLRDKNNKVLNVINESNNSDATLAASILKSFIR